MFKVNCCSSARDFGLLVLRLFVGGTFIFHGVFKAMRMDETVRSFAEIKFSAFWAYVATYSEIIGGILLVFGIFTLYAAILLGIVMCVAAFKVKWGLPNVPFLGRYLLSEIDLSLLASLIAIACVGPGAWSLSRFCKCKCHGTGGKCGVCTAVGCDDCKSAAISSLSGPVSSGM